MSETHALLAVALLEGVFGLLAVLRLRRRCAQALDARDHARVQAREARETEALALLKLGVVRGALTQRSEPGGVPLTPAGCRAIGQFWFDRAELLENATGKALGLHGRWSS